MNKPSTWNGACAALLFCAAAIALPAQTLTVLANFNGMDGATPHGMVQGADGNFYGTTEEGGGSCGCGTVFKVTPGGVLTDLYNFDIVHGAAPVGSLVQATDGNLYGTTTSGGTSTACMGFGCGTVFKITPGGALTTVYSFSGPDGSNPSWLMQASDGNFYGTTAEGASQTCKAGCGTVFQLTPGGTLTTLHTFNGADGDGPVGLLQASDGNLYGTTGLGGAGPSCAGGCGTVFKLSLGGALTTLYSFGTSGFTDGWTPSFLMQANDGNFYGTTSNGGNTTEMEGGITTGVGTIFKITAGGALTTLYEFTLAGGAFPSYGLVQANDGNLYGATGQGPANSACACGMLFKITLAGTLTTLLNLDETSGGGDLLRMVLSTDGNLYGTDGGGNGNSGTVFKLALASSTTSPTISESGGIVNGASFQAGIAPGSWITIKGTNLSSVTDTWANAIVNGNLPTSLDGVKVSVGGEPAYIAYVSPTQINAVAPNVATGTLPVTVTNSSGTSSPINALIQAAQPSFFQWPGNYAVATTQDYNLAVKNGTFPGVTTTPAKPGEVIILWGTGFGPTSPAAPTGVEVPSSKTYNTANTVNVTVGGKTATVYGAALAPGFAGLYQVAIMIPASLANGDYPVVASVSGAKSPSTTLITVQQ